MSETSFDRGEPRFLAKVGRVAIAANDDPQALFVEMPGPWVEGWDKIGHLVRGAGAKFGNLGERKVWRLPLQRAAFVASETRRMASSENHAATSRIADFADAVERALNGGSTIIKAKQHRVDVTPSPAILARLKEVLPEGFDTKPFQAHGVELIHAYKDRALLADDMGLGKTISVIAYHLAYRADKGPLLVISPTNVKDKWRDEIQTWGARLGIKALVHKAEKHDDKPLPVGPGQPYQAFIISPDSIEGRVRQIASVPFATTAMDEMHYFKTYDIDRTKSLLQLFHRMQVGARIAMSGTPMPNDARELFTTLRVIRPEIFGLPDRAPEEAWSSAYNTWVERTAFMGMKRMRDHSKKPDANGEVPTTLKPVYGTRDPVALYNLLSYGHKNGPSAGKTPVMIRRLKSQVGGFPAKERRYVHIANQAIDVKALVASSVKKIQAAKNTKEREDAFASLRSETGRAKVPGAIDLGVSAAAAHEQIVLFCHHHEVAEAIEAGLLANGVKSTMITGKVSEKKRLPAAKSFLAGETPVCICTQAAREGLNLISARHLVLVERECVPYCELQAEDRIYRIGQTRDCIITYLHLEDSPDDRLGAIIDRKKRDIEHAIEGNLCWDPAGDLTTSLISAVIKNFASDAVDAA